MLPATKGNQITSNEKENANINAESGFLSQVDFSCTTTSSSSLLDVSVLRQKSCVPSFRGSYQQQSFSDSHHHQSPSSGYGSHSDASKLAILATPGKNRKRKSEVTETDENFYNSYQFVSPLKQRKRDPSDKNCAKLILKEKCPSENVILSSTPIRAEQRASKWGKFRSFHPEKLQFGKSLCDEETTPPVKETHDSSLNFSSINFSNASFTTDIPSENVKNLLAADIIETEPEPKHVSSATIIEPLNTRPRYGENKRIDILGMLNPRYENSVCKILNFLDAKSLLNLSHVSRDYRKIIVSNKTYEAKRRIYLNHHRSIVENKYPSCVRRISTSSYIKKKALESSNLVNQQSSMILRQRPITPPQSPQKRKQQITRKCPRCRKPAVIKKISIRHSPRKNRNKKRTEGSAAILNLSPNCQGRVSKKSPSRSFLQKSSIYCLDKAHAINKCLTMPVLLGDGRRSSSSSCESPSSGDDLMSCSNTETYEFAECSAIGCGYKFCVKCNCKYHPRFLCRDLSPPSPSRISRTPVACTKSSLHSLKRLAYD